MVAVAATEKKTEERAIVPALPTTAVVKPSTPPQHGQPTTTQAAGKIKRVNPVSTSKVKSVRLTSTQPPAKAKGETLKKNKILRDRAIDANVDIDPAILSFLYSQVQKEPKDEINGFGHVDEAGLLDWASIVSVGTAGAVMSSAEDMAWATVQCLGATDEVPNMQLHTHPAFDTFFSGTDVNDIIRFVKETRDNLDVEVGEMYFMVFNLESWLIRKVEWALKGVFFNDGVLSANGIEFQDSTKTTAVMAGSGYGHTNYNYNNNYQGNKKPATTPTPHQAGLTQQPAGNVVTQVKPAAKPIKQVPVDPTQPALQTYLQNGEVYGEQYGESWWDYAKDGDYLPSGTVIRGTNNIPHKASVPVLMTHPLENMVEIEDLITAFDRKEPLLGFVVDASFFDVLEIRNHLNWTKKSDVWDTLVKEIRAADTKKTPEEDAIKDFVEMIVQSNKTGNIADAAMVLDVCDWFTGWDALIKLQDVDVGLYKTLLATHGGYTFGMLLILISENLTRAPSESQAAEANQKLLSRLPADTLEQFQMYLDKVWDDNGKVQADAKA